MENFAGGVPPNNWVVDRVHFDANVTSRNMWETYLPTFESCLREAKAGSVMCSFNSIAGVPACANGPLINGVLRKRWGWDGFVVSDYDAQGLRHQFWAVSPAFPAGCTTPPAARGVLYLAAMRVEC